jgi:hypothetical protein
VVVVVDLMVLVVLAADLVAAAVEAVAQQLLVGHKLEQVLEDKVLP